ncbi:hypothetical protein E2C01_047344 [Portunus trituberculatus]|uniref:Uncharacterized protein n=1 Tax=Portunus trituberculatus TaxID=210409 RepID=A0A5B7G8A1_PORTR|nr:hypothetical protein [Portunus trituberculatus]
MQLMTQREAGTRILHMQSGLSSLTPLPLDTLSHTRHLPIKLASLSHLENEIDGLTRTAL